MSIDFSLQARQTTPTFDSAIDIKTNLINDRRVVTEDSMLYSRLKFCLVHTVDSYANEGWLRCDVAKRYYECVLCVLCLLANQNSAFK